MFFVSVYIGRINVDAIDKLPLTNTPDVIGLSGNAEIGYNTENILDIWRHLRKLQPQRGL